MKSLLNYSFSCVVKTQIISLKDLWDMNESHFSWEKTSEKKMTKDLPSQMSNTLNTK